MEITASSWSEVDIAELARLIYAVRRAELEARQLTLEALEDRLQIVGCPYGVVQARSDGALIGCVLLYGPDASTDFLVVNPGRILGTHPIVAPGSDGLPVSHALVEQAKNWARENRFVSLLLDFPWEPSAPDAVSDETRQWYEALGFRLVERVRQMTCDLSKAIPPGEPPASFQVVQAREVDADGLYQCHYAAGLAGGVRDFGRMDDEARRTEFDRLNSTYGKSEKASLVLVRGEEVVGYTLVASDGDVCELALMGIHPGYRRRGLGEFLLRASMQEAAQQGLRSLSVILEIDNQPAARLCEKVGFEDRGGSVTFECRV